MLETQQSFGNRYSSWYKPLRFGGNPTLLIKLRSEAWWWQRHVVRMLSISRDEETRQG